jgi:hypothetical protein
MILRIYRDSALVFSSEDIIEHSIDGISLSSVDYWSQEARKATVKLSYTPALKALLEGASREVKAGYHTLNFVIGYRNEDIFSGVLQEGAYSLEYYTPTRQRVELELTDYFGLLVTLAADREHQLGASTHPINVLPAIIHSCFTLQSEDERNQNNPAEVIRLVQSLACLSYANAHETYNPESWLPWRVVDHEIYDHTTDMFSNYDFATSRTQFGFRMVEGQFCIYFQHYVEIRRPHSASFQYNGQQVTFVKLYRVRIYRLIQDRKELFGYADIESTSLNPVPINPEWPTDLFQIMWGEESYRISGTKVLYSGSISIGEIETVPGWYNAKNLLEEFLRLSHAVIKCSLGQFSILNRIDDNRSQFALNDPIEAKFDEAEPMSELSSSPVAIVSLALLEAVDRYYMRYLRSRNLLHEAIISFSVLQLSELTPIGSEATPPANPYDLVYCNLLFDSRLIHPREVEYDIYTGLITLRGWS